MRYFLTRVSSRDQNLARQLAVARGYFDIPDENVFCDKASGKDFDRPEYQRLKSIVRPGDEVIVKEFDRFGRNKKEMKRELEWFREHGVAVRILDIPTTLIDFKDQTWVLDMVNNILIEVLGTIAEQERKKTRQRQAEGIAAMPIVDGKRVSGKTGRPMGRPESKCPGFQKFFKMQKDGSITVEAACKEMGISRSQWYNLSRKKKAGLPSAKSTSRPDGQTPKDGADTEIVSCAS